MLAGGIVVVWVNALQAAQDLAQPADVAGAVARAPAVDAQHQRRRGGEAGERRRCEEELHVRFLEDVADEEDSGRAGVALVFIDMPRQQRGFFVPFGQSPVRLCGTWHFILWPLSVLRPLFP